MSETLGALHSKSGTGALVSESMEVGRAEADADAALQRFLFNLAYAGALASLVSITSMLVVMVARTGTETPPLLYVGCLTVFLSSAFAPLLLPAVARGRLLEHRWVWPLTALAVLLSVALALVFGKTLLAVYAIAAAVGVARAVPHLRKMRRSELILLLLIPPALSLYLLSAQHRLPFAHVFAPEQALLGTLNSDSLYHMAISSMIERFGTPSMGADGLVPVKYHIGSHIWFAGMAALTGTSPRFTYPIGQAVVAIPWLYLSLFLATAATRRWMVGTTDSAPRTSNTTALLFLAITAVLLLDWLGWSQYYLSESYTFGLIVLLASVPLFRDLVGANWGERSPGAARLATAIIVVFIAGVMKISVGFLLGAGLGFLALRQFSGPLRTATVFGGLGLVALAIARWIRPIHGSDLSISLLHFYRTPPPFGFDSSGALWALVPPLLYVLAVVATRRGRITAPRGERRMAELVLVVTIVAMLPGLFLELPGWDIPWFQNTPQWLALPLLLCWSGLAEPDTRWFRILAAVVLVGVLGVCLTGVEPRRLARLGSRVIAGVEGKMLSEEDTWSRMRQSLSRDGTVFGSEFAAKLRETRGARVIEAVDAARTATGSDRLTVFVPPSDREYWEGDSPLSCVQRAVWIPAVAGVPLLRGVRPDCLKMRFYDFSKYYDQGSLNRPLADDALCELAAERGFATILVLPSIDDSSRDRLLDCPL